MSKDAPTGKTVLLFSGGMDSLCLSRLLAPDVLLYVRHGSRYEADELAALPRIQPWLPYEVTFADIPLGHLERPDAIIPLRNLLFVTLAATYGEEIWLGAMSGDRSLDKSPEFCRQASALLTYLYGPQHWCEPRSIRVYAPRKTSTKTELVRDYLAAPGSPLALLASLSCYDPVRGRPCGTCKACFRKWVALENNGIPTPGYFVHRPPSAPWLPAVEMQVRAGTYRGAEDADWRRALGWETL